MRGSLGDRRAVLATNHLEALELFQLVHILAGSNTQYPEKSCIQCHHYRQHDPNGFGKCQ